MHENNLRKGWEIKRLADVCDVFDGQRRPINRTERANRIAGKLEDELFPYFGATGQVGFIDGFLFDGEYVLLGEDGAPFLEPFKPKAYLASGKFWVNNHAHILKSRYSNKFLCYYLNQVSYGEFVTGTTRLKLNQSAMKDIPCVNPPIEEQERIVAKIEELFSELDAGVKSLKKAQAQLKTYRQAVLKSAFEGRLTNQNVPDGELPSGWKLVKLEEVADVNPKIPNRESIADNLEIQFLPMKLVEEVSGKIHLAETRKYCEVKKGYTQFIDDDVIFAKVTPCMENGKIAVVRKLKNGIGAGSTEFHVIRVGGKVTSEYIFNFLVQERFRHEAEREMTGAVGLRRVPKQFIEGYEIPLCAREEQQRIVEEIESRLSVCDKLEETIVASLKQSEALRQSILKQAFEGNLV